MAQPTTCSSSVRNEQDKAGGEALLKKVIVPLDGSPLAETVLPYVIDLAKKMRLEVVLMRAYALPPSVAGEDYGFYSADFLDQIEAEARDYLAEKVKEVQGQGLGKCLLSSERWLWRRRDYYACPQNTG